MDTDILVSLLPFGTFSLTYFVYYAITAPRTLDHALFKILPIYSLILFIIFQKQNEEKLSDLSKKIIQALFVSSLGDIFLVWSNNYFVYGLALFGIAHILYANAFGDYFHLKTCVILFSSGLVSFLVLFPMLSQEMLILVGSYSYLLIRMALRAISRFLNSEEQHTATKFLTALGSLLFLLSDLILSVDIFLFKFSYSNVLVMLTYYAAQFGLALSVLDENLTVKK